MKKLNFMIALGLVLVVFTNCKRDDIIDLFPDNEEEQTDPDMEEEEEEEEENGIDASFGLVANDLQEHPMQDIAKPAYLDTIIDPSFGTTIRRISEAEEGSFIVPIYSTIQAWNADESYMILYEGGGRHRLLDGMDYTFIRYLDDVTPTSLEQIWWDFDDPDTFFYVDSSNQQLTEYSVSTQEKNEIVNLQELVDCPGGTTSGNDIQMMSADSDVVGFRCGNITYYYRISTGEVTEFNIEDISFTAAMPAPSGELFYHGQAVYGTDGQKTNDLNEASVEHSCLGSFSNGGDAHYAVAFAEGPLGGCLGNIVAHDMETGGCFNVISEEKGYGFSKSGTHISSLAHKNPGYIAASMIGFERDGQKLLDQELVLARVDQDGNSDVYRIGHHRSDEDEIDYWGEPHAVISPTGTRVLFGSDWSGEDDGISVDSYVVELPAFTR